MAERAIIAEGQLSNRSQENGVAIAATGAEATSHRQVDASDIAQD